MRSSLRRLVIADFHGAVATPHTFQQATFTVGSAAQPLSRKEPEPPGAASSTRQRKVKGKERDEQRETETGKGKQKAPPKPVNSTRSQTSERTTYRAATVEDLPEESVRL